MLNSEWLCRMLEKSGATPNARMLALFDILQDWIEAPHMRQLLLSQPADTTHTRLLNYLTAQARSSGFDQPESLAYQLCFIALGALREEMSHPGCHAMAQAHQAAAILIAAKQPQTSTIRRHRRSIAAAFVALLGLGSAIALSPTDFSGPPDSALHSEAMTQPTLAASPLQVSVLHEEIERMRRGDCHYPQALMLPNEQRGVFLETIVDGNISPSTPHSAQEMRQLMQKVDCYYAPIAMIAS